MGDIWDNIIEWVRYGPAGAWGVVYRAGVMIFGFLAWLMAWVITWFAFGFMGFMAGWLPSILIGAIVGFLWPLIALGITIAGVAAAINSGYFGY